MTAEEIVSAIHSRSRFSASASLARISRLMERLGNPQDRYPCIHIAGTNGKGSVAAMVDAALRASGYRTGLFTSPYLVDFRERIQVNRRLIPEEQLIACYESVMAAETELETDGMEPVNEFELVTAVGFLAFARAGIDYAVIEVGLGGRCDATNVIARPAVTAITPVSLDHTAILGSTVREIAGEKAGILKPGCPVVVARQEPEARAVILQRAAEQGSPVTEIGQLQPGSGDKTGQTFRYDGQELTLPLLGRHQMENAATAWEICRILGLRPEHVQTGLSGVSWPGRLQRIPGSPELLIDAGHNPAGIAAVCEVLDTLFSGRAVYAVMAMMRDKDFRQCIPQIASRASVLVAATVALPRSLPPEDLAAVAAPYCETRTAESVAAGMETAKALAPDDALVLVCGSVYAAGAALREIGPAPDSGTEPGWDEPDGNEKP